MAPESFVLYHWHSTINENCIGPDLTITDIVHQRGKDYFSPQGVFAQLFFCSNEEEIESGDHAMIYGTVDGINNSSKFIIYNCEGGDG